MNSVSPESYVHIGAGGLISISTSNQKCELSAYIVPSTPTVLSLANIETHPDFRRKKLATMALLHTVNIAQEVTGNGIETLECAVINPIVIPMLDKIFSGRTQWFAEQSDLENRQNQIDRLYARILCAIRQEQAIEFDKRKVEVPVGFDSGVYGLVSLR